MLISVIVTSFSLSFSCKFANNFFSQTLQQNILHLRRTNGSFYFLTMMTLWIVSRYLHAGNIFISSSVPFEDGSRKRGVCGCHDLGDQNVWRMAHGSAYVVCQRYFLIFGNAYVDTIYGTILDIQRTVT